ncbi:MAG: tetratricopeptide repeat protein, partial [Acidobacteria bacterium]|nr:tetratricopeptide repeat protein [Acidobacteriota bacterium]
MKWNNKYFRSVHKGVIVLFLIVFTAGVSDPDSEETIAEKIKGLEKKLATAQGKERADILMQLAVEYRSVDVEKAVDMGLQSWKLARKISYREGEAAVLAELSKCYVFASDYAQAEKFARLSLDAYKAIRDVKGKAASYNCIGNALSSQGRLQEALEYFEQSLRLRRRIGDEDGITGSLHNIGLIYMRMNRYPDSLVYYRDAEREARRMNDGGKLAIILCNKGIAHEYLAQYDLALDCYQESLRCHEEAGNKYYSAILLNNVGGIHMNLCQYDDALECFKKALKILEETGSRDVQATVLYNIGAVCDEYGRYAETLEYYRKSLEISRSIEDIYSAAYYQLYIGKCLMSLGEDEKAEAELKQAMETARTLSADDMLGDGWLYLGDLYRKLRRLEEAGRAFNKALEKGESTGKLFLIWKALFGGGQVQEEAGDTDGAIRSYERAIQRIEDVRGQLRSEEFRTGFLQQKVTVYEALARLRVRRGTPDDLKAAFNTCERARARSFLDLLMLRKLGDPSGNLKSVNPVPLELEGVQSTLEGETKLVEYMVTDEEVLAFVICRRTFQVKVLGIGRKKLEAKVFKLREPFEEYKKGRIDLSHLRFDLNAAHELYRILFAPLEAGLAGNGGPSRLIIIPDDSLYYLPFEALVVAHAPGSASGLLFSEYEQAKYLLKKYPISYSFSASMLDPRWQKKRMSSDRIAAFGNPAALERKGLPPLPRSGDEAEAIRNVFGSENCAVYTGKLAAESLFKKNAGKFSFVHIATHGIVSSANPLRSRLYFSGEDPSGEDGILYGDEIYSLRLNCRLLTLSACE